MLRNRAEQNRIDWLMTADEASERAAFALLCVNLAGIRLRWWMQTIAPWLTVLLLGIVLGVWLVVR